MVRELMPNGLFVSYKRGGRRRQKSSRAERTKCCRTDSELLSPFLFSLSSTSSRTCAGFVEASRCSWTALSASCSTSNPFFCPVCRVTQGSASVRRPVRLSLVSISSPIAGCIALIVSLLVVISTYSLLFPSVSFSVRVLCVCWAVSLCNHRSSVVIGSLCNRISPYLLLFLALRSKTPVVPPPFHTQGRSNPTSW